MRSKSNIQLNLSVAERKTLRKNKVKKSEILDYTAIELEQLMNISATRAKEIHAYADFQRIPSIGIEFAKDLVFLGYHRVHELVGKHGAQLTDEFEKKQGCKTDPCVEDQFRSEVDFAENGDYSKKWWDFTTERKRYRKGIGYPKDRPNARRLS